MTKPTIIEPVDAGDAISKILQILAKEVRCNKRLQTEIAKALAPVVTVTSQPDLDDFFAADDLPRGFRFWRRS